MLLPYPKPHMRGHDSYNDVFETPVQIRKDAEACLIFAEYHSTVLEHVLLFYIHTGLSEDFQILCLQR